MINFIDISSFKKKFATFLSKLYYSGSLSLEHISYSIVNSYNFSFLENGDLKSFMDIIILLHKLL